MSRNKIKKEKQKSQRDLLANQYDMFMKYIITYLHISDSDVVVLPKDVVQLQVNLWKETKGIQT